jgi:hypothetical protein
MVSSQMREPQGMSGDNATPGRLFLRVSSFIVCYAYCATVEKV